MVFDAESGPDALKLLQSQPVDMVLLDVMMPEMDGREVLSRIKQDSNLRHLPVVMISAFNELDIVAECIEAGAEDYLPKPLNSTLLEARIKSCLEKKRWHDQELALRQKLETLLIETEMQKEAAESARNQLSEELIEAALYVRSILPSPLQEPVRLEWQFIPSAHLGGDSCGYHWMDSDHLALYLLDVCGHGVGAALLSISVMNLLRNQSLPGVDFQAPVQVLSALNDAFPMERHNGQFFTIWYGVYCRTDQSLSFASAGHPAPLFFDGSTMRSLEAPGPTIGIIRKPVFKEASLTIPKGSELFVFSDGIFEVRNPEDVWLDYKGFSQLLQEMPDRNLESVLSAVTGYCESFSFEDDVSILHAVFK